MSKLNLEINSYNQGLDTAIKIVKEFNFEEQETVICGLEGSKIQLNCPNCGNNPPKGVPPVKFG